MEELPHQFKDIFFAAALHKKEDKLKELLDSDWLSLQQIQALARSTAYARRAVHTPLYMAAVTGNMAAVKLLLPYSDLEQKGECTCYEEYSKEREEHDGATALWGAAEAGQDEIVSYLLDRGANVNAKTDQYDRIFRCIEIWTPLRIASRNGHTEVIKSLLTNKRATTVDGVLTALWEATDYCQREIVEYLISRKKDLVSLEDNVEKIDAWDDLGMTCIFRFSDLDSCLKVWEYGIDLEIVELKQKYNPKSILSKWVTFIYHYHCLEQDPCDFPLEFYHVIRAFKLSIKELEVWMSIPEAKRHTHWADHFQVILQAILYLLQILIKLRYQTNHVHEEDLMTEIRRLVKLNPKGFYQQSLLHIGCSFIENCLGESHFPKLGVIKLLLEAGANPNTTDDLGKTPLQVLDTTQQCLSAELIKKHKIKFSGLYKILSTNRGDIEEENDRVLQQLRYLFSQH